MYIFQPDRILLKQQIKKYAHLIKGVVLDAGSGRDKRYIGYLQYDRYITLDIDSRNHPDIVASIENTLLKAESVDSVICTQVLGDVANPEGALKEINRILRPGGVIILTESLLNELHDEPHDLWRFTPFGFRHLFNQADFEIIAIDQRGGFFSSIAQLKIRYLIDRFGLYDHWWWGKIFNQILTPYGKFMIFLDTFDKSTANRKHALGWCVVARKK